MHVPARAVLPVGKIKGVILQTCSARHAKKDVKKQKEMLDLSLFISKLMEEGRMQEGIVFDNDK